ncbi:MAG: multicopper oxidase domain-containing protein, partial [Armatimonadetes bacterium]|nr:multicopper oxidase domain-containing protein [Armatimonadota bacterium]
DVDRTIILDERALDFTTAVAMGQAELRGVDGGNGRGGAFQYDLFLMDGKAASAIPIINVKPNQRILIRIINLGNLTHAMHLHGHTYRIVAKDGNPVPPTAQLRMDTVQLSPGERFDIEFVAYNPGVWMFHCHMPNHGDNGMMTMMQYEGFKPIGPVGHALHLAAPPAPAPQTAAATVSSPRRGPVVTVPMLDNRFAPASMVIKAGTTVRWLNRGQNIHTTTSLDGSWDSPGLDRKQSFAFTFTKAGEYRYLCRQHLLNGMVGTITVK